MQIRSKSYRVRMSLCCDVVSSRMLLIEVRHLARHGIKRTPLPGVPTVDKRYSIVHRGVSCDGRFVVEVSKIRSEIVIRHKI